MASAAKYPYQKLIDEGGLFEEIDDLHNERDGVLVKSRSWFGFRRVGIRIRRRIRLNFPGLRQKIRVVSAVRLSCSKVLKRLKESQAHFGDLFAGNYLFLQVNPPNSIKSCQPNNNLNLHALPSPYSSNAF